MQLKKITHLTIASLLLVALFGVGAVYWWQKVSADTIVPGYATAHLHFEVTVPRAQTITLKATFTPPTGKNFYFKQRDFDLKAEGLNTIDWYIRKIPGSNYDLTLFSPQGSLKNSPANVSLTQDKSNDTGTFSLYIGSPELITPPTQVETSPVAASATQTASDSSSFVQFPPVPQLPTQTPS